MHKLKWARISAGIGLLLSAGCAPVLIGAGALGGYAISKDSISNNFDLSYSHVYSVSHDILGKDGLITQADEQRGLIKATVAGGNVTVTVKRLTARTVQLKVKARNELLMPKIDVAQAIYNQIVEKL